MRDEEERLGGSGGFGRWLREGTSFHAQGDEAVEMQKQDLSFSDVVMIV